MEQRELDLWAKLEREYPELSAGIMVDPAALGSAVIEHSEDHRRASENWVYAKRLLAYAVREKATVWAQRCTAARQAQTDAIADGGPKVTDKSVEAEVRADDVYLDAAFQLDEVLQLVGLYEELSKRYHGRGFRLRDLVTLHESGRDRDYIKDEAPSRRRTYYGPESRDESADEQSTEDPPEPDDAPSSVPARRRRFGEIK